MNDENLCKGCGHSIDWHRFLVTNKPDACLFAKTNISPYCSCNKFVFKTNVK